jgi:predicted CXXCH cytochrome family protein
MTTCATCHSRRGQIAEGYLPGADYHDYYRLASIAPPLYHPDGQILDEVYVYGSFLQSRMYEAGVTCADCHDAHRAAVRVEGDALCTRCHNDVGATERFPELAAGRYDDPGHHFHPPESPGARCVACHMPETTYMVVDPRRDHSLRVPRPDRSVALGVPNACTGCHADRDASWAAGRVEQWYGTERPDHFADAFAVGVLGEFGAEQALAEIARSPRHSALVRTSALDALAPYEGGASREAFMEALPSSDPLILRGALPALERLPPARRWPTLSRVLENPSLMARLEAVPVAVGFEGAGSAGAVDPLSIARVLAEYRAAQLLNADWPEAHANLAGILRAMGDARGAEQELERALDLEPRWIPALVNLADLYRETGRDVAGGAWLERAVAVGPPSAEAAYAFGLWLVRQGSRDAALAQFRRARDLSPDSRDYGYVYAVALQDAGRVDDARLVLRDLLSRFGDHRTILEALVVMDRAVGDARAALAHAERLAGAHGGAYETMLVDLRRELAASQGNQ